MIPRAALCAALCVPVAAVADTPPPIELLSILGLPLKANEYLLDFKISTFGVEILSVCHVPPAWVLKAGSYGDTEGELSGEGGVAPAHLRTNELTVLRDLYLVRVHLAEAHTNPPFSGKARAMTFAGSDGRQNIRTFSIEPKNLRLRPARRCPDVQG